LQAVHVSRLSWPGLSDGGSVCVPLQSVSGDGEADLAVLQLVSMAAQDHQWDIPTKHQQWAGTPGLSEASDL
jgi:hypothetical protein